MLSLLVASCVDDDRAGIRAHREHLLQGLARRARTGELFRFEGGIISLTRTLAIELARHDITVNAVAPGLIDTPTFRNFRPDVQERLVKMQPNGRVGKPEDVANGVLFFASDASSYVTGQTMHICGGKSLASSYQ